jgi:hypothetical protein
MKLFDYGEETLPRAVFFCWAIILGVGVAVAIISPSVLAYFALQFLMN